MRATALVPVAAAVLCIGGAAPAATAAGPEGVIGGPQLASTGIVVDPLANAPALPTDLTSSSWLVADADTGSVLAAKAAHERFLPASTLKTLTALTLIPRLDPTAMEPVSERDAGVDGSKVGLVPGMRYSVATLFTSLLVVSANDAADALAEAGGGLPQTVAAMNAEAQHLQAHDTVAKTPSGLDAEGETSSAYDLALFARAGLQLPDFVHYIGIVHSTVPAPKHTHFDIYTHNHLLTTYRGMIGGKNGYTVKAQATYVGIASRGGHTIIITLMHANPDFWPEAKSLLDWGFAADGNVAPVGTLVGPAVPQPATHTSGVADRTAIVLVDHHHGGGVSDLEIGALAASAGLAVAITSRRRRRRPRLSLPPL